MYKQKIEVIIYSENKILLQDITLEHVNIEDSLTPILREPTAKELIKILNAAQNTIGNTTD